VQDWSNVQYNSTDSSDTDSALFEEFNCVLEEEEERYAAYAGMSDQENLKFLRERDTIFVCRSMRVGMFGAQQSSGYKPRASRKRGIAPRHQLEYHTLFANKASKPNPANESALPSE
jgi:hypothetical protein